MRLRSESGQAATENLAVIAVLVIAIIGATYTFVPTFSSGVDGLAKDAKHILATGKIGDLGVERGSNDDDTNDPNGADGGKTAGSDADPTGVGQGDGDGGLSTGDGGTGRPGVSAADGAASRQMAPGSSQGSDAPSIGKEKTDDPTSALPPGPGGMGAAVSP